MKRKILREAFITLLPFIIGGLMVNPLVAACGWFAIGYIFHDIRIKKFPPNVAEVMFALFCAIEAFLGVILLHPLLGKFITILSERPT